MTTNQDIINEIDRMIANTKAKREIANSIKGSTAAYAYGEAVLTLIDLKGWLLQRMAIEAE